MFVRNLDPEPPTEPLPWRRPLHTLRPALPIAFHNILFATDFSSAATRALPYAVEIARKSQAKIHAVHVISPPVSPAASPEEWSQILHDDEALREGGTIEPEKELQGLPHDLLFLKGDVWENLKQVIEDESADLLVIGTHGRTGLSRALMGSVAEKILRLAPCPVLTVGPEVATKRSHAKAAELNCILYATDFSRESFAAARYAISLAREYRADLILLHTVRTGNVLEEDASLETLRAVVPWGAELPRSPKFIVEHGDPGEAILRVAANFRADLIVVGARATEDHMTVATHFGHSTAHQILTAALCPMLTVNN